MGEREARVRPSRFPPVGSWRGMRVVEATTDSDFSSAKSLIEEYASSLEVDLDFQGFREEIARFPGDYVPPSGTVLLAYDKGEPVGSSPSDGKTTRSAR